MANPIQAVAAAAANSFAWTATPFDIALDGSGSTTTNPGATIVEYAWAIVYKPPGSTASLVQPSPSNPGATLHNVDTQGSVLLWLRVKDSTGAWSDGLLDADDAARVVVVLRSQHQDWTIPAAAQRNWQDLVYPILTALDGYVPSAPSVDNASIDLNGSSQLEVKAGGITTEKIAAQAVTAAKLGTDIAGDGLGGGSGVALSVNVDGATLEIVGDAVQVADGGIDSLQLADGAVGTAEIAAGAVTTAKIAAQAVTAAKLGSDVAGAGLGGGSGAALSVNTDGATLEVVSDTVRVKDAGIVAAKIGAQAVTAAKLGSDVAGAGLGGGSGAALSVNTDGATLEVVSDTVRVKDAGIVAAKIGAQAVTAAKLGSDVAGSGLQGGAGTALAVKVDNSTIKIGGSGLYADVATFNPDNSTLEIATGVAQIKSGGVTLAQAGSGLFVDPGRPDYALLWLAGAGATFLGYESIAIYLNGVLLDTLNAGAGDTMSDLATNGINLNGLVSPFVKATYVAAASGEYIDLVVVDSGAIRNGHALTIVCGHYTGIVNNSALHSTNGGEALASAKRAVCGVSRRLNSDDVTRGIIVFDFDLTIVSAIVQFSNGTNVLNNTTPKVTWSGQRLIIDNAGAGVAFTATGFVTVIAYGEPV